MRKIAGWVAILAALPYITLKTLWVAGIGVGVNDPDLMNAPDILVANAFTGGLEVVAVVVALALIRPWGMRLTAWPLVFPMWVGTGLLAPIVAMVPLAYGVELLRPGTLASSSALDAWVPVVVYGGFTVQALALLTAFALYSRERWVKLLRGNTSDVPTGPTHRLQRLLAFAAAGLAAASAIPSAATLFAGTFNEGLQRGVAVVLALLAVIGLLHLVRVRPARMWTAVVLSWLGTAGLFATGALMLLLNVLAVVAGEVPDPWGATELTAIVQMLAAMIGGTVAAFTLAERDWEAKVSDEATIFTSMSIRT